LTNMNEASPTAGEPAAGHEDLHTAPRGDHSEAALAFTRGASDVRIHPEQEAERLFTARFTGRQPTVSAARGTVSIRYPAQLSRRTGGDVTLNPHLTWAIRVQGDASRLNADLTQVGLSAIDIDGGASQVTLRLPPPGDVTVPVRIGGGASHVTVLRPAGVVARLTVSKGAADLAFDEQRFGAVGGEIKLQSPPAPGQTGCYEISIGSGASHLIVATT
jgi:hypothetical protein